MGLKKSKFSHKLKNIKIIPKTVEPDLNSLQTKIGIQSRFVETLAANTTKLSSDIAKLAANNTGLVMEALNSTIKKEGMKNNFFQINNNIFFLISNNTFFFKIYFLFFSFIRTNTEQLCYK